MGVLLVGIIVYFLLSSFLEKKEEPVSFKRKTNRHNNDCMFIYTLHDNDQNDHDDHDNHYDHGGDN